MLCAPAIEIPEDIARLVFDEILIDGDTTAFRTAALISSTFLYVAQCHLYRTYTLNLRDPHALEKLTLFLDIIDRSPYIGSLVKEIIIVDQSTTGRVSKHATLFATHHGSLVLQPYATSMLPQNPPVVELFISNTQNLLPRLFTALTSLSRASIVLAQGSLYWSALHPDVRYALGSSILAGSQQLDGVHLIGICDIPAEHVDGLLDCDELQIHNCSFNLPTTLSLPQIQPTLLRHPIRYFELLDIAGTGSAGLARLVELWKSSGILLPRAKALRLALNGWHAVADLASVLHCFGQHIQELTLSTKGLGLRYLLQQPPPDPHTWPSSHQIRLPQFDTHEKGECFSSTDSDDPLTIALARQLCTSPEISNNRDWFPSSMIALRPTYHPPLENLQKLNFEISHWRSAEDVQSNGELYWVISYLAELPFSGAQHVQELTITIDVGTDFCLDNPDAMVELVQYQGWMLLDLALTHSSWKGLRKVMIAVQSRTSCLCGAEEGLCLMMEWLKARKLPCLNSSGVLNVQYIPLR